MVDLKFFRIVKYGAALDHDNTVRRQSEARAAPEDKCRQVSLFYEKCMFRRGISNLWFLFFHCDIIGL
jgi:hypothetical protein